MPRSTRRSKRLSYQGRDSPGRSSDATPSDSGPRKRRRIGRERSTASSGRERKSRERKSRSDSTSGRTTTRTQTLNPNGRQNFQRTRESSPAPDSLGPDLRSWKVKELKDALRRRGLGISGSRWQLVERLRQSSTQTLNPDGRQNFQRKRKHSPAPGPDYTSWSIGKLRGELRSRGLGISGNKAELLERLALDNSKIEVGSPVSDWPSRAGDVSTLGSAPRASPQHLKDTKWESSSDESDELEVSFDNPSSSVRQTNRPVERIAPTARELFPDKKNGRSRSNLLQRVAVAAALITALFACIKAMQPSYCIDGAPRGNCTPCPEGGLCSKGQFLRCLDGRMREYGWWSGPRCPPCPSKAICNNGLFEKCVNGYFESSWSIFAPRRSRMCVNPQRDRVKRKMSALAEWQLGEIDANRICQYSGVEGLNATELRIRMMPKFSQKDRKELVDGIEELFVEWRKGTRGNPNIDTMIFYEDGIFKSSQGEFYLPFSCMAWRWAQARVKECASADESKAWTGSLWVRICSKLPSAYVAGPSALALIAICIWLWLRRVSGQRTRQIVENVLVDLKSAPGTPKPILNLEKKFRTLGSPDEMKEAIRILKREFTVHETEEVVEGYQRTCLQYNDA